jgi:uncharacterized membrane protein YfcA
LSPHFTATTAVLLALLGLGVGVFGTLVGAGGGFILTPVLLLIYPKSTPELITAISLVAVFFNASSGSFAYIRRRRVDYRSGMIFALCTLPGSVIGVLLANTVSRPGFDVGMGLALTALAVWLLKGGGRSEEHATSGSPRRIVDRDGNVYEYRARVKLGAALSVAVGVISSFLGIGGGVVHVPLLVTILGFPTHVATATSHFVLAWMTLVATITHVASGTFAHLLGLRRAASISVGIVIGAQAGARLSDRISGRSIQKLLAAGLLILGVRLILSVILSGG